MSKPRLPQTTPVVLMTCTRGPKTAPGGSKTTPGVLGPYTETVQLRHFIYFSPSSASGEGEYGILEPKFPDGGHCQSVLRRQWVLLLPPSMSG